MLARKTSSKLPIAAGDRDPASGALLLPSSPLERDPFSHKGWKNRDSGGVGLSIVAKLDAAASVDGDGVRRRLSFVCAGTAPIPIGSSPVAEAGCSCEQLEADGENFPVADFLRRCYLCRKRLHGKDIYMYRGEKGFCSEECRYQQIVSDECLEKWGSEVFRRADVSTSPCSGDGGKNGRLFSGGIAAA